MNPLLAYLRRIYWALDRTHCARLWISAILFLPLFYVFHEEPFTYDSLAFDDRTSRLVAMKQNDNDVVVEVHDVDYQVPRIISTGYLMERKRKNHESADKIAKDGSDFYYYQIDYMIYKTNAVSHKTWPVADRTEKDAVFDVDISNASSKEYPWVNKYLKSKDIDVYLARLSPLKDLLAVVTYSNELLIMNLKYKSVFLCDLGEYTKQNIQDVLFAGNDKLLIAGEDISILSYNIKHNKVKQLLDLQEKSLHLLPLEWNVYAVSTDSNSVVIFQGENGQLIWRKQMNDVVTSMAYMPGYKCLAIGGHDIQLVNLSPFL